MGIIDNFIQSFNVTKRDILMDLAGDLKLTYFAAREDAPAYVTGTYSGRGVTLDRLSEKGYFDNWHPHGRVIVSLNQSRRETHMVTKKGGFYSRKMGEVPVNNKEFNEKYMLLSSSPNMAKKILTPEVVTWIVKLEIPFQLTGSSIIYSQDHDFRDRTRVRHIVDALVYMANLYDRIGINA